MASNYDDGPVEDLFECENGCDTSCTENCDYYGDCDMCSLSGTGRCQDCIHSTQK